MYRVCKSYRKAVSLLKKQRITISPSGLRNLVLRYRSTGCVSDRRRSGRPRNTNSRENRRLIQIACKNREKSHSELTEAFNTSCETSLSSRTVRRRLKSAGYARRVPLKVPILTRKQLDNRLTFANKYAKARINFWSSVCFSDEKIFEYGKGTRKLVTRKTGQRLSKSCLRPIPKRGLSVHVWGVISFDGVGPIRKVDGNLNARNYQENIIWDIDDVCNVTRQNGRKRRLFQQDNAPAHAAKSTANFLAQKRVTTLFWPGNSPDLNPIEHVWSDMSRRLGARGRPANAEELWNWVMEEWDRTDIRYIHSLYHSMPNRLKEVLDNEGGHTHY